MGPQPSASEKRGSTLRIVVSVIAALATAVAGHGVQSLMGADPSPTVSGAAGAAAAAVAIGVFMATAPRRG